MHGLLRCNINTGVHGRVIQRCHNSPRWETGLQSAGDVMHRKCAEDLGRFWRKSESWKLDTKRDGWLSLARRSLGQVSHEMGGGGGRWKSQNWKIVPLSPYFKIFFNSKVIKSFVPEPRSCKCFPCFEIPMFYVIYIYIYIYIYIWTVYVRFTHSISWLWYTYTIGKPPEHWFDMLPQKWAGLERKSSKGLAE